MVLRIHWLASTVTSLAKVEFPMDGMEVVSPTGKDLMRRSRQRPRSLVDLGGARFCEYTELGLRKLPS